MILSVQEISKKELKTLSFIYEIFTRTNFNLQQLNILFMIIRARMKINLSRRAYCRPLRYIVFHLINIH